MPRIASALTAVIVIALTLLQIQLANLVRGADTAFIELPAERTYHLSPRAYQTLCFGHVASAVDWLLIRFLAEDPGYAHVAKGVHPPGFYDVDLATSLDPLFFEMYMWGSMLLSVVRDDTTGARHILEKGEAFRKAELSQYPPEFRQAYWRSEWAMPFMLAYVYLFDFHDLPDSARSFRDASQVSGAPAYLAALSRRFEKPGGNYEIASRILDQMIRDAPDEDAKEKLEAKQLDLTRQTFMADLNRRYHEKPFAFPAKDPWGGVLSLHDGKIVTTTPYERVFGLD